MAITRKTSEEKSSGLLGKILFLYQPYWPLFLALLSIFIGAALVYVHYSSPVYEITARVLIKDERKGAEEAKTVESLDGLSSKKIIENEVEVLQSKTLLDQAVVQLHLYASVYEEKSFQTLSAYITSPVKIVAENLEDLKEARKIYFTFDNNKTQVIINNTPYPLNEFVSTPYGTLKFLNNNQYIPSFGSTNKKLFFSISDPKAVASGIAANLTVVPASKLSSIIDISYKDEVPQRGEDIVNQILSSYNAANVRDKSVLANNTLNFIDERLKRVGHDLDSIERRMESFRARKGAIDISTQGRLYLQNVSSNDQKLGEVNTQLAVLDQVERYVRSKDKAGGIVPSTLGVTDPTLTSLVSKLYNAELEYESLKKTTGDNNPVLVSVTDQIEKIKPSILENIKSQKSSLLASRNNIASTNDLYSSSLQTIPEKERELIDINRQQGIKNEIYNFLLQKREETALSHASTVSDNSVIDKAQSSDKPVNSKKKVILLASVLAAFASGAGIVFCKENLGGKIMFRHEIEELTQQPVIGEIASEPSKDPIVVGDGRRTLIAEQFRKIRATLNYIGIDSSRKKILVTSSIPGEGKSFVATNLALSLAMTGKKVALLDFDLNNPSLNNKLNISKNRGITEYLNEECKAEDIVRPTDLHRNLYLVATGKLPKNPSELLMSIRVKELFFYLESCFDYIVVDTAPVVPVTDAYILSDYCDATLYIVRHAYTPKSMVERIDKNNEMNKLNNIAIVFNGVTPRGFGNKHYGYGYGYGDSYGYIDDKRKSQRLLSFSKS